MKRSLICETVRSILHANEGDENFKEFLSRPDKDFALYHHTTGRAMRNSLSLWEDNELTAEFKSIGIWHADDMSATIIHAVHRIGNCRRPNIERLRDVFHTHWRRMGVDPWTGATLDDSDNKEQAEEDDSNDNDRHTDIGLRPSEPA